MGSERQEFVAALEVGDKVRIQSGDLPWWFGLGIHAWGVIEDIDVFPSSYGGLHRVFLVRLDRKMLGLFAGKRWFEEWDVSGRRQERER